MRRTPNPQAGANKGLILGGAAVLGVLILAVVGLAVGLMGNDKKDSPTASNDRPAEQTFAIRNAGTPSAGPTWPTLWPTLWTTLWPTGRSVATGAAARRCPITPEAPATNPPLRLRSPGQPLPNGRSLPASRRRPSPRKPLRPSPHGATPRFPLACSRRSKNATVFIEVEYPDGSSGTGTGYFDEPGIVLTNAHVVGMMDADSKAPKKIDVVLNGGEKGSHYLDGTVLGVDRDSDLAVFRWTRPPTCPSP